MYNKLSFQYNHLDVVNNKPLFYYLVNFCYNTIIFVHSELCTNFHFVKMAAIFTADGSEISASTLMDILLMNDFKLVINKITYDVQCPKKEKLSIKPRSEAKTSGLLWTGLALLSVQGGALAWLTWWVYSWDIMEPVTYFITFANSMVFFAYFIVTRQDYTYSAVKKRQFLHFFHKKSKKEHFDVVQYNKFKEDLAKATESLKQVRHSLCLRMQGEEVNEKN
ncbi:calcium uniporter regulatory subunit MCUb, mitochondrial-like [Mustela erminea]|uniref:calcium uniporter regulatory subunit MCUb, mitochondrial-like n=1 Tax=Mustela erminea TaxID=36723 RepID=UPI0013875770|nr:calcium uniporter regulatory subunit MCUb, mitochondrial-like [Mustela erminea]